MITSSGGPLHWSKRVGKDKVIFLMPKFRTLRSNTPQLATHLLEDPEKYYTPIGKFLRKTSLDELPQFINVLRNEMSIVGPRPLLIEYLPLYSSEQARRHNVRPGITGWAQVNGRNAISWKKKFELDVWYVDNNSIWLDIKIISMTFLRVMVRSGIDDDIGVGQEKFKGNQ